jgi:superfamily II DNA or RNA helicase
VEEKLTTETATDNEKMLNEHGSRSKQQHMDTSLPMQLAKLCFLHLGTDSPQISGNDQGIYSLHTPPAEAPVFTLTLPRDHTWELLDKLKAGGSSGKSSSPARARQFCRVAFADNGRDIVVENWCRLADGREFRLQELETHRYGTRYRVDDLIFSLKPIPEKERLAAARERRQLSLFDAPAVPASSTGFTVPAPEVAAFLAAHRTQLHSGFHQVAAEILDMKIVQMPDRLVLDQYDEDQDWCYLAGWYGMGSHRVRLIDLLRAAESGQSLLVGPVTVQLDRSLLSWFHGLGTDRIVQGDQGDRIRLRRSEFLALTAQVGRLDMERGTDQGTLPEFVLADNGPTHLPTDRLAAHLRPYQQHGTAWMYQLQQYRLGGILADDMGLGKTHQALALVSLLAGGDNRFLLVCPAAVLYHWPEKQERFFPELSLAVYHGQGRDLEQALESQIIVTTYGVLRRDIDLLAETRFRLVVFDEMHALKNRATGAHAAAARLQADTIIGLTGTPVENRISELAGLLSLCLPALFQLAPVRTMFQQGDGPESRERLQRFVAPFLLRRTRAQVLDDLPECSEDIRLCTLSDDQIAAYRQAADQALGRLDDDELLPDFSHVLTTIIRLKQICNHLSQLEKSTDWTLHASGKWDEFTRLLAQSLEADLKVVVFSQFTTMLDIIEAWLTHEKIAHVGLRGSVGAGQRGAMIRRFNSDPDCRVCCASLLAGGTGIDLTGAQVVIHYDRWWNPAKEEQATARVHRMGQHHPVQVYKLVTAGTLEEKIHRIIEEKRRLAADLVVEDDGSILKTLDRSRLADLFRLAR